MFQFVAKRRLAFTFTGIMIVVCVAALLIPPRLPFGLEFSSGTSLTVEFREPVDIEEVRSRLADIDHEEATVQALNDTTFFIRTGFVEEDLLDRLEEAFGPLTTTEFERSSDLAQTVLFVDTVTLEDVQAAFGTELPENIHVESVGPDRYFIAAPGLSQDDLAEVFNAWESIGVTTRTDFDDTSFVEVLTFPDDAKLGQSEVDLVLAGLGGLGSVLAVPEGQTLLVAARSLEDDGGAKLVEALVDRFGEADRRMIDPAQEPVFLVEFTDTITLDQVLKSLVVLPISSAVGDNTTVTPLGNSTFLLQGDELAVLGDRDLANLEDDLGGIIQNTFEDTTDLALNLGLGTPSISTSSLQAEAVGQGRMALVPTPLGENRYAILDSTITEEELADLLEGFQVRFGRAEVTNFAKEDDLTVRLFFPEDVDVDIEELRNEIGLLGFDDVTAIDEGSSFPILANDMKVDRQRLLLEGISIRFGEFTQDDISISPGAAFILDFGPPFSLDDVTKIVSDTAGGDVTIALSTTQNAFLLFGTEAANYQERIVAAIELNYGLAEVAPFDFTKQGFFTIQPADLDRAIQRVTDLLIVQQDKPNQFFLAGNRLTSTQQSLAVAALRSHLGELLSESFNFTENVAQTLSFERPVSPKVIENELSAVGYTDLVAVVRGDGIFIRGSRADTDGRSVLLAALSALAPIDTEAVNFASVDAEIAKRSILNTLWAVLAGTVGILVYVWWAFRRIPKSYRYGLAAILGLAHDVLMVLGLFGLLSKFTGVEINSLMIVGVLAVIGYSVNNTIVVFDRIRENVAKSPGRAFEVSVNLSLNETLTRNLNTSLTTAAAVLAVILFGGETIREFMAVLLAGVIAGTYSSLMLAPNILVAAEKGELPRLRLPFRSNRAATP